MRLRLLALLPFLPRCFPAAAATPSSTDERVKAAWSEVLNQYQRRADLRPIWSNHREGLRQPCEEVLTQVTEALLPALAALPRRPELINNPQAFAQFQQARPASPARCRACWWLPRTTRT